MSDQLDLLSYKAPPSREFDRSARFIEFKTSPEYAAALDALLPRFDRKHWWLGLVAEGTDREVLVEVAPSTQAGFWHVAILASCEYVTTRRPISREGVLAMLVLEGFDVSTATWTTKSAGVRKHNPFERAA